MEMMEVPRKPIHRNISPKPANVELTSETSIKKINKPKFHKKLSKGPKQPMNLSSEATEKFSNLEHRVKELTKSFQANSKVLYEMINKFIDLSFETLDRNRMEELRRTLLIRRDQLKKIQDVYRPDMVEVRKPMRMQKGEEKIEKEKKGRPHSATNKSGLSTLFKAGDANTLKKEEQSSTRATTPKKKSMKLKSKENSSNDTTTTIMKSALKKKRDNTATASLETPNATRKHQEEEVKNDTKKQTPIETNITVLKQKMIDKNLKNEKQIKEPLEKIDQNINNESGKILSDIALFQQCAKHNSVKDIVNLFETCGKLSKTEAPNITQSQPGASSTLSASSIPPPDGLYMTYLIPKRDKECVDPVFGDMNAFEDDYENVRKEEHFHEVMERQDSNSETNGTYTMNERSALLREIISQEISSNIANLYPLPGSSISNNHLNFSRNLFVISEEAIKSSMEELEM